ncbi:xanthine dehydrogenase family protein molybdopterin-binding subunit [Amycolatopsis jejuensis]|uniref:xanthine dehydrogenase family protein molybdopterin-binding subunit n=1 Tax=Amycolatopsis jejuensis TaxID=330084 RepID=UPI000526719D|nr:xanthine dehydrogenase family protein molybdopterin-binding subunit [Amycolatopsis jejuensis]
MSILPIAPRPTVGTSAPRAEDVRLLLGEGQFIGNVALGYRLEIAFLRATEASARITHLDTSAAAAAEGVTAVLTAEDLGTANGPVPVVWQQPGLRIPHYPALASGEVHYAGQPVAAVVARSRALAEDAVGLIDIDYEPRPPVVDPVAALDPGAPVVHAELGSNEGYQDVARTGDIDAAFAAAAVVVEETLRIQRQTALPMECRSVVARPEADGRLTVWATVQQPHLFRDHLAEVLGLPPERLHVIVPDLGGAFGAYYEVYPEDIVAAFAARHLGEAVRYLEDRQESFLSTVHARQQVHRAALALSSDGLLLGFRDRIVADLGAFADYSGAGTALVTKTFATGAYHLPATEIGLRCAYTNTVRVGAYRGFGQPEATFVIERMMDVAAARLGMDPLELRKRNAVGPDRMPYAMPSGAVIDSGDFPSLLDTAKEAIKYDAPRASTTGRRVGVGFALYVEYTGSGPSGQLGARGYRSPGWEGATAELRRDGTVQVYSGVSHLGQGIRTGLAQVIADRLAVDPSRVVVTTGDTDLVRYGNRGSIGSRSAVVAGNAVHEAASSLARKITELAGQLLEASPDDIVLHDSRVSVRGTAGSVSYAELADEAYLRHRTTATGLPVLEATSFYHPTGSPTASGVHAARVEVDVETGEVEIVEGQVLGGTAQGIGGALFEEVVYDADGQIKTASMMDYLVPTAMEIPDVTIIHQETPSPLNPLGVKGAGEAGTIAPPAALANAVSDALGVQATSLPLSPSVVWGLIRGRAR